MERFPDHVRAFVDRECWTFAKTRRSGRARPARPLVVPEGPAAEQQEERTSSR